MSQKTNLAISDDKRVLIVQFVKDRDDQLYGDITPSWSPYDQDKTWGEVLEYW